MRKRLLFALIITILTACDGPSLLSPCGGKDEFWESGLDFSVYDKGSQAQLLGIYGRYNIIHGKVLDQQGNVVVPGPIELSGNIYLFYLNRDTD